VDVTNNTSLDNAVAQLLNPSPEEQVKEEKLEQETLEEETQEVTTEEVDEEVEAEVEEDTEVETEEDEGDVEVGDSDEEEEESEAQEMTNEGDLHTVKVDGEEYEVNLEELKKGYQLEQNYTKRVQKLQEESKEIDTLKTNLNAERQQYLQLMELAATTQMAEVNKAKELLGTIDKEADPVSYVTQQLRVQDIEDNLRQSVAGFQQAKVQADQQHQEQRAKIVHQEQEKLSSLIPEWVSPDFQKSVIDYAKEQGYSDSDLSNVISARDVSVINKARLYDELVSKKATVKKKRQPVVKKKVKASSPATAQTRKARAVKEQRQKLKRSGKVTDAASAILSLTS
jgi:hypothetical protein